MIIGHVGSATRKGFFRGAKGTRMEMGVSEDLMEVEWFAEIYDGFFKKL